MSQLKELLTHEMQDLLDAETQLTEALPKMAEASSSQDLRNAFQHHLEQTRRQTERLEEIFEKLDESAKGEKCKGIAGIIDEGEDLKGYLHWATIEHKEAYSGNRCLTIKDRDAVAVAPWPEGSKVFGETLPNWDFEIVREQIVRSHPSNGRALYLIMSLGLRSRQVSFAR